MKLNKLLITVFAGASMALVGCQDNNEDQHYDNKLFISASNFTKEIKFKSGDANVQEGIAVAIAKPEVHDIKVTMAPAPEMLGTYKMAYADEAAVVLPAEHYSMPETTVTLEAGGIESEKLPIEFINIGSLDLKTTYVLPVTITTVEGIDLLQSAKTYYYVFRGASLINMVCNISRNCAYPDFNNDAAFNNLTQNTLEILFKADAFPNQLNTLMGIEGNYLLRCGDAGVPSDQLQVATSKGNLTSADLKFELDKWYHLAVTFDAGAITVYVNGVEKYSGRVNLSSVSLGAAHSDESNGKPRCFWIGYSYNKDRFFDGVISEVRIWNRALTAEEIQATNHFYTVDPASDGLISYWKFDEGLGQVAKDYSASGYNMTIENVPTWVGVSLPQ
jgi:hypothetical protein